MSSLTKILVVLQLVFSLVLAVLVVFGMSRIENYRSEVTAANNAENAATIGLAKERADKDAQQSDFDQKLAALKASEAPLQDSNNQLRQKNTELAVSLAAAESKTARSDDNVSHLTTTVDSLQQVVKTKDDEIARIQPENVKLIQQNAELNQANNELTTENRYAEMAIRKLQEQVAAAPETKTGAVNPAAAGNDAQVKNLSATPANGPINGQITDSRVSSGRTLVELSLGERDGVAVNSKFTIYRGSSYIGDATVQTVTPDKSVAVVTITKPGQTVHTGDMVLSNNGQ